MAWLYGKNDSLPDADPLEMVGIWLMADKYCLEALKNYTIDKLKQYYHHSVLLPAMFEIIRTKYCSTGKLRDFLIAQVAADYQWIRPSDDTIEEEMSSLLEQGGPDAMAIFKYVAGKPQTEAVHHSRFIRERNRPSRSLVKREYHDHLATEKC